MTKNTIPDSTKIVERLRTHAPNEAAYRCEKCEAWSCPFTTKVEQSGWTLCSECHTHPNQELTDFSEIDWEFRKIRFLGKPGDKKYDERHHKCLSDGD